MKPHFSRGKLSELSSTLYSAEGMQRKNYQNLRYHKMHKEQEWVGIQKIHQKQLLITLSTLRRVTLVNWQIATKQ